MVKINSKQHITKNGKIKNNPKKRLIKSSTAFLHIYPTRTVKRSVYTYPKKIKIFYESDEELRRQGGGNDFGMYELTLVTEKNVYYYRFKNRFFDLRKNSTIMYNRHPYMKRSYHYGFAYMSFIEDIIRLYPTKSWVWASKTFMENAEDLYNFYKDD